MYFPAAPAWYDAVTGVRHAGTGLSTVEAPLSKIPVYQRGGTIVPRQMRARRSSAQVRVFALTEQLVTLPDKILRSLVADGGRPLHARHCARPHYWRRRGHAVPR